MKKRALPGRMEQTPAIGQTALPVEKGALDLTHQYACSAESFGTKW